MTASERVKLWRLDNPEKLEIQRNKWNASEKARRAKNRWESKNRDKIRVQRRTRMQNNPTLRAEKSLRVRMRAAIRAVGARKTYRSEELFGATPKALRSHLEAGFRDGMTWENYGSVWHIDHIRPCSNFDLTDPEQQRICFKWDNLQPLLAAENLKKGDRCP